MGLMKNLASYGPRRPTGRSVSEGFQIFLDPKDHAEIIRRLSLIPEKAFRSVVVPATKHAFAPLRVAVAGRIGGYRSGSLYAAIVQEGIVYHRNKAAVQLVGPSKSFRGPNGERPSLYMHLLEFGVGPHEITLKHPLSLPRKDGMGKMYFPAGTTLHHPGFPARAPLRKSFDAEKHNVLRIFADKVRVGLDRLVRRLAKKGIKIEGLTP